MKKLNFIFFLILIFFLFTLTACTPNMSKSENQKITVAAAISMSDALNELGKKFMDQNPTIQVHFNYGASGILQQQIEQGSPIDVFISAGEKQMEILNNKGFILTESIKNLAKNTIVLVIPANKKSSITSFQELTQNDIQKIAIGNPKTVPAGQYGKEVLEYYKLYSLLQDKLVFAENVRQALTMVSTGNVDAGIVYRTDAIINSEVKIICEAPEITHSPVVYPIGIVKSTSLKENSQKWLDFIFSDTGKKILDKYGFKSY